LNYPVVVSGGALHGGEGHDTLTVRAVDSLDLVQRTAAQQVVVSFNGSYKAGDIVSVSFGGGEPYEYVVQNGDVVLGDAEATRANVVNGLAQVLGEAQEELSGEGESLPFTFDAEGADLTLVATAIAADIDVSAVGGEVKTVQASDARITGFETLNLIAENVVEGEDANDNDGEAAREISVDFDLISGVEQVNLASEVTL